MNAIGTAKDLHEATQVDMWLMTSQQGQDVQMMIGADDASVVWRRKTAMAMAHPPMKAERNCTADVYRSTTQCPSIDVVDEERLQRQLDEIDQEYRDEINPKN